MASGDPAVRLPRLYHLQRPADRHSGRQRTAGEIFIFDGREIHPVSGFEDYAASRGNVVSCFRFIPFNGPLLFSVDHGVHGQELRQMIED